MKIFRSVSMEKGLLWRRCLSFLLFGVLILGWIPGCGKKADPIPLRIVVPPAISDLRAEKKDRGIELRWSTAIEEGRFKILRSEQFPDEEVCQDCPRNYVVVQEMNIGESQLRYDRKKDLYSWIDPAVKVENSYFYRIVVCNASGYCSEPSNVIMVPANLRSDVK
ncbi:hypothetical protein SAMN04489760_10596 [Syntrophus gentianae]|uniref:Fibronectin type-III domain-containing protein n=1 Tax=Syntrophus gentianae TaxID=43775 RepID=A0A1H7W207_9BACT|nr:hypothetical protein [Syntrophus gentianae]SEM15095.1 hypothetical protein SAMN04489760_10596 [Syntrophus gentianae]